LKKWNEKIVDEDEEYTTIYEQINKNEIIDDEEDK
jgi:hypothetical protein